MGIIKTTLEDASTNIVNKEDNNKPRKVWFDQECRIIEEQKKWQD